MVGWDVLLDGISVKDQIESFSIRDTKGAYAREMSLVASDPAFYDQFDYGSLPQLRIEIKIKNGQDWETQGKFYIEKPVIETQINSESSPGIWGRSETAKAGQPFSQKVTKAWTQDTTCYAIMTEMADLCGLTIVYEMEDYPIFANSYAVSSAYPVDVITELARFAGGYTGSSPAGELVIKQDLFHPVVEDYIITDSDIIEITENVEYPDFGNRIKISSGVTGSNYSIKVQTEKGDACLPKDGNSSIILLAFVNDSAGDPVPDNTLVNWTSDAAATLDQAVTATGDYTLVNQKYKAKDYYNVDVDFPIKEVLGVWAYSDSGNTNNFFDQLSTFKNRTITVDTSFAFCDQTLRVSYVTLGCASNKLKAGTTSSVIEVTADVQGSTGTLTVQQGNTCACGSSLNIRQNPDGNICLGKMAHILVWATINNLPATGYKVQIREKAGCGQLSSENKILKTAKILNEAGCAENNIAGISQVKTAIIPADSAVPQVFLKTDTYKTQDLYSSHIDNIIDLNTLLETGIEVAIDYTADGAVLVAWRTLGAVKDCTADIVITMADGTEAGLRETLKLSAIDCTVSPDIPDYDDDYSDYDPVDDDQNADDDGGFDDDGNPFDSDVGDQTVLDPCDVAVLNRISNIDNAVDDNSRNAARFGTGSKEACVSNNWGCPCSDLCDSEIHEQGHTYDFSKTIHDIVLGIYPDGEGTPEYNEAFEAERQNQMNICQQNCEDARDNACKECTVTGPDVLDPGESAEYVCGDGSVGTFTMPEGQCGTVTWTLGCCSFEVRSSAGRWVEIEYEEWTQNWPYGCYESGYGSCTWDFKEGGSWYQGTAMCITDGASCNNAGGHEPLCSPPFSGDCTGGGEVGKGALITSSYYVFEWQCE